MFSSPEKHLGVAKPELVLVQLTAVQLNAAAHLVDVHAAGQSVHGRLDELDVRLAHVELAARALQEAEPER